MGTLYDWNGRPRAGEIINLEIKYNHPLMSATTDANGKFIFDGLETGIYNLSYQNGGEIRKQALVEQKDNIISLDLQMSQPMLSGCDYQDVIYPDVEPPTELLIPKLRPPLEKMKQ